MKILSVQQIRALDAYTIANTPIASIDLMERACRAFFSWFITRFDDRQRIGIVCGTGNNGGDGVGIARLLHAHGYDVRCWIIKSSMPLSPDFTVNLERAKEAGVILFEVTEPYADLFTDRDLVVDALLGSGLSRPAQGLYAWAIDEMNAAKAHRIAVDIPSGLMADEPSRGPVVKCDYTLTFQLPKLAFMLPSNAAYVGDWSVVNIGLDKSFIREADTHFYYTRNRYARKNIRRRNRFDHKGTHGHALLIAGSLGKTGAALMASRAALRSGVGLLTTHIPRCGNIILQTAVPEAMTSLDQHEEMVTSPPSLDAFSAVGIGPGIGRHADTVRAFEFVLRNARKPIVVDADGLNILAENKSLLTALPEGSILTPHLKEFERLAGSLPNDFARLDGLSALAGKLRCIIVLKGAFTAVADPEGHVFFNSTGNPGMATGGTGDVLTGIVTGLLAQHYAPLDAARLGVYLHGLAGDLAVMDKGPHALIATDLIEYLPDAYLHATVQR